LQLFLLIGEGITKLIGNRYVTTINVANRKTCWAAGIQNGASTITESNISKTPQEIKEDLLKDWAEFPQVFLDMVTNTDPVNLFHGPLMVHEMPLMTDQGWGGILCYMYFYDDHYLPFLFPFTYIYIRPCLDVLHVLCICV
jgi:hypothetical protein